jgi:hypothetical protein
MHMTFPFRALICLRPSRVQVSSGLKQKQINVNGAIRDSFTSPSVVYSKSAFTSDGRAGQFSPPSISVPPGPTRSTSVISGSGSSRAFQSDLWESSLVCLSDAGGRIFDAGQSRWRPPGQCGLPAQRQEGPGPCPRMSSQRLGDVLQQRSYLCLRRLRSIYR